MTDSGSNGKRGKGFAGLDSMVSDVSESVGKAAKAASPKDSAPELPPSEPPPQSSRPEPRSAPAESPPADSRKSGLVWVIVGVTVLVIWIANSGSGTKSQPAPPYSPPPSHSSPPAPAPAPAQVQVQVQPVKPSPKSATPSHKPDANARKDATAKDNFPEGEAKVEWLTEMGSRLSGKVPDRDSRVDILKTVSYEAKRAGLDPQLILAVIDVSSGFKKYAVDGDPERRGLMAVPSFWIEKIGKGDDNLFHLRTNLRFGCTILRHYLDNSDGNVKSALEKYGGTATGNEEFARRVIAASTHVWKYPGMPKTLPATVAKSKVEKPPLPAPVRSSFCNINFNIDLETFGEGVTVELRAGVPGNSKVLSFKRSTGGRVGFSGLCPGQHFLAIGNEDSVSVTPTRVFETGVSYSSRLTLQRGAGNVSKRRRGEL